MEDPVVAGKVAVEGIFKLHCGPTQSYRCFVEDSVLYPEEGVCADPVDEGAILGEGGGKPPSSDRERQLATDIVGEKT
jgi:hypothetical protein